MSSVLLPIGTRVEHAFTPGHGAGQVVGYNSTPSESVYSGQRYPYRIRFDSGYEDVYTPTDIIEQTPSGRP